MGATGHGEIINTLGTAKERAHSLHSKLCGHARTQNTQNTHAAHAGALAHHDYLVFGNAVFLQLLFALLT